MTDFDQVVNDYIGGFSEKERKIVMKFSIYPILHLFSGKSTIGDIRIDLNPDSNATHLVDVFEAIKRIDNNSYNINTILMDPIYCSEQRKEIWREKYKCNEKDLYIFPYDTKKTKLLWNFFQKIYPKRIIIKSLNHYTIPGYELIQGYDIYPGAFKPNRCISIYQAKNNRLDNYVRER